MPPSTLPWFVLLAGSALFLTACPCQRGLDSQPERFEAPPAEQEPAQAPPSEAKGQPAQGSEPAQGEPAQGEPAQGEPAQGEPAAGQAEPQAVAAYRRHVKNFTGDQGDAYFQGFVDPLVCFFGEEGVALSQVKQRRQGQVGTELYSRELAQVRASGDEALLVDRGVWINEDSSGVHEKAILMRRVAGAWKVAGEAPLAQAACLSEGFAGVETPAALQRCRQRTAACHKKCQAQFCAQPSNSCQVCTEECTQDMLGCMKLEGARD